MVDEINSDKVIFGDSDLFTSKLRPYLGYTILNDRSKLHIGTTELLPFKVKEAVSPEFVRYLLLRNEYLVKSTYLMYGKEHPRIQIEDILRIMVPKVPQLLQETIVQEIKAKENTNNARR